MGILWIITYYTIIVLEMIYKIYKKEKTWVANILLAMGALITLIWFYLSN